MRIENNLPPVFSQIPVQSQFYSPMRQPQNQGGPGGSGMAAAGAGVIVDISPQAQAAYAQSIGDDSRTETVSPAEAAASLECATCASRTYQDVSDDSSVSFQTPTHISPGQSAAAVAAHESEHVANEQANAQREGREIISQTVSLSTSICPECKRVYVSGGTTRTLSRQDNQENNLAAMGLEPMTERI